MLVDFITDKMNGLEEQDDEDLLTFHHLQHMLLNEISLKLHHSWTWGYRRHDVALKNLDNLLANIKEGDIPLPSYPVNLHKPVPHCLVRVFLQGKRM